MIESITQIITALKEIIVALLAIIGYLWERNKREKIEKAYIDIKAKFEITQQNTQQVKNDVTQAVNLTTQINISEEDRKKIAELLLGAVTLSRGTLAITAPPIAFAKNEAAARLLGGTFLFPWQKENKEHK